jgi:hypothetical protein
MGLITKKTEQSANTDIELSKDEVELLLELVGNSTIQVKRIEKAYHLIIKLQKLHGSYNS